jgi:DNA repair protein RecO (recombination protein O)
MTRPHDYQTNAIIIKKTKLGEADRILTLYTPEFGKIQAVAKGVRRPKSKMAGHLELLTYSQITLARGRNLDTITGSQTIEGFLPLKTDLWLTAYGLYLLELVNQFTADHVPDEASFQLLLAALQNLCRSVNKDMLLRHFELHLLDIAGYRPQLHECVSCHQLLEPVVNSFSASAGGVLCPVCAMKQSFARPISVNALKVLRFLQDNSYETAEKLKIDSSLADEVESIMRSYLRYLMERELKSAAWLDEMREQLKQVAAQPKPVQPSTGTE